MFLEQPEHHLAFRQFEFIDQGVIETLADLHWCQRVLGEDIGRFQRQMIETCLQVGNLLAEFCAGFRTHVLDQHQVFHVVLADQAEFIIEFFGFLGGFFRLRDGIRAQQLECMGHEVGCDFGFLVL